MNASIARPTARALGLGRPIPDHPSEGSPYKCYRCGRRWTLLYHEPGGVKPICSVCWSADESHRIARGDGPGSSSATGEPEHQLGNRLCYRKVRPVRETQARTVKQTFIRRLLCSGTSPETIRDAYNALASLSPEHAVKRWGYSAREVAGSGPITVSDVRRVLRLLPDGDRAERDLALSEMNLRVEADRREAERIGLPAPTKSYQRAHDAGVFYRATQDEEPPEPYPEDGEP